MKPFQSECGVVKRKAYEKPGWDEKKGCPKTVYVKELLCQEIIWFEPSLKPGVFVGRCRLESHNPVYKILTPSEFLERTEEKVNN